MATPGRENSWRILFLSSIVILAGNHLIRSLSYGWETADSVGGLIIIFLGGAFQWILFRDRFFPGKESIEAMYERRTAIVLGSEFTEKLKFKNFRELAGESFLFRIAVVLTIIVLVLSMGRYEILPLREGAGFFTVLVALSLAVSFIPDFFYFPVVLSSFSLMEMALRLFGSSSTRALICFIIIGGEIVFFMWLVTSLVKITRFSFKKSPRYRFDHLDWIKVFLQFAGFLVLCFLLLPEKKEGYLKKGQDNFLKRGERYERELRRKYGRELKEIGKDLKAILKERAKVGGPSNIKNSRRAMELLSSLEKGTGSGEIRIGGEQKFAPDRVAASEGSMKTDPARLEEIIKHLTEMEKQMRSTSRGGSQNELQKTSGEDHIDSTGEEPPELLKAINSLKKIKSDIEGSGEVIKKGGVSTSEGFPSSVEEVASKTLPEAEGESEKDFLSRTEKFSGKLKAVNRNTDFRKPFMLLKDKLKNLLNCL